MNTKLGSLYRQGFLGFRREKTGIVRIAPPLGLLRFEPASAVKVAITRTCDIASGTTRMIGGKTGKFGPPRAPKSIAETRQIVLHGFRDH